MDVAIAIVLFIVAAVPRVADLGTFLTADEKNWMGRSYEFIRAVKDWRFNDTLQTTHPGVTTTWLSGTAITAWMFLTHTPFSYQTLAHFAAAAQLPIALANSFAVPVIYLFLRRIFTSNSTYEVESRFLPVVAALLTALNPLLIGYSRVAHVDALLASLVFLAALAIIIYAQTGYRRGWLLAAAVLSGLAILTKFPAVFLVPFFILVLLVYEPGFWKKAGALRSRARDFTLWLLIVVLMFLIIWPAMLFVPNLKGNVLILKRDLGAAAVTPHNTVEDYTLNSHHYPLALLTRTNPVTLVFGGLAILWLLLKIPMSKNLWLLMGYIFFFIVMMTIVAKKGDRYILPVFPAIDLLAAFGIWGLIGHWSLGLGNLRLRLQYVLGFLSIVYLVATIWNYHPYAIAYSNPLFRDNLSQELGWGEGLEQVAAWLNENHPKAIVASWYPDELGAYTSAQVAHINAHEQSKVQFVVLYRNMFGRSPDHYANNFIDEYYKKREPVFVAKVAGKEFAWVYPKWAFDRVVGELTPGVEVEENVPVTHDNLVGVDVMVATYSGRAKAGELIVSLDDFSWRVPIATIQDDRWLTLRLPEVRSLTGKTVVVKIETQGTSVRNAPTLRANAEGLAVRLRYSVGGQEATEEDTLLLK